MDTTESPDVTSDVSNEGDDINSQTVDMRGFILVIGCLGVMGNGFVIFVIFNSKHLRRRLANVLIINQSMIDFTVGMLLIGDATTKFVAGYGVGLKGLAGKLYCKLWLNSLLLWSMMVASTYNLIAITIERYMMVVYPIVHKTVFTRRRVMCVAVATWFVGLAYELPTGMPTTIVRDGSCVFFTNFPSLTWQEAYGFVTITIAFFVPMLVHPILYSHMVVVLRRKGFGAVHPPPAASATGGNDVPAQPKMSRAQNNLLKTLFYVTVCFFLCWAWNELTYLCFNLGVDVDLTGSFYLFTIAAANCNCCINPFIYIFKYDDFKKAARNLVLRSHRVEPSSYT